MREVVRNQNQAEIESIKGYLYYRIIQSLRTQIKEIHLLFGTTKVDFGTIIQS